MTLKQWQYFSPAIVYAPLIPKLCWSCVRQRMTLCQLLSANPVSKFGGAVIDSKFDLYKLFRHSKYAVPTAVTTSSRDIQESSLAMQMQEEGISFPVIVKPDVGFHSHRVRRVDSLPDLAAYLMSQRGRYIIQQFVSDPLEYGIYYLRMPGEASGAILDLTERILPHVYGDGQSSVYELIDKRPEWKQSARAIKKRIAIGTLRRIPTQGECVRLSDAASLAEGALFIDSRALRTAALERHINDLASVDGFFIGKFDFKVPSVEHLLQGDGLKLLEVNGVTSELNWIYDLRTPYGEACRAIQAQLASIVAIARLNRRYKTPSFTSVLVRALCAFLPLRGGSEVRRQER